MLVAIPSVTKYIEKSRKSTFITSVKNLVGAVRYGVVSEDSKYDMGNATEKVFALKDIETEKGKMEDVEGYVKVIKTTEGYQFKVKVSGSTIEKNNYCCDEVDIEVFGNNLGKCQTVDKTYAIGDTVEYAGSNWRVIKNSTGNEDYVTLMKERVLTNAELGEYAYNGTYDTMEYTWTETCHEANRGYSSYDFSNCDNTNGYATSKVKEMLEIRYLPTIGADNLKEVDGYKIRLITLEELDNNLGCNSSDYSCKSSQYATWVHQNFGDQSKNVYAYWTMTPHPDYSSYVWFVGSNGRVSDDDVNYLRSSGVRPVINLLKSNIS